MLRQYYQRRTAAFLPDPFLLSKTFFGTKTSKKRQSSVSCGFGVGVVPAPCEAANAASAAVKLKAVAFPSMNAAENRLPIAPQAGLACGHILPCAPVCTVVFRPVGATGALKRSLPTGG